MLFAGAPLQLSDYWYSVATPQVVLNLVTLSHLMAHQVMLHCLCCGVNMPCWWATRLLPAFPYWLYCTTLGFNMRLSWPAGS